MGKNMKERITETSVILFNKNGSHCTTTNHIIAEMSISPGTFYYHFKNKEEIIRNIFLLITEDFETVMNGFTEEPNMKGIVSGLENMFRLYYKYRFFYTEISSLLDRDSELEKLYKKNFKLKKDKMISLFTLLEEYDIFKKGFTSSDDLKNISDILWIVSDYWVSFLKTEDKLEEENVKSGYKNYLHLLKPFLSDQALKDVDNYI